VREVVSNGPNRHNVHFVLLVERVSKTISFVRRAGRDTLVAPSKAHRTSGVSEIFDMLRKSVPIANVRKGNAGSGLICSCIAAPSPSQNDQLSADPWIDVIRKTFNFLLTYPDYCPLHL
jgi:hypothetical protein